MKIPKEWDVDSNDPLFTRAQEILDDLYLEYGVPIVMWLEESTYTVPPLIGEEPEVINYVNRLYYRIGDHEFETIRELRKALENKAFM